MYIIITNVTVCNINKNSYFIALFLRNDYMIFPIKSIRSKCGKFGPGDVPTIECVSTSQSLLSTLFTSLLLLCTYEFLMSVCTTIVFLVIFAN